MTQNKPTENRMKCEVCRGNVVVIGNTTKYYKNLDQEKISALQEEIEELKKSRSTSFLLKQIEEKRATIRVMIKENNELKSKINELERVNLFVKSIKDA